MKVLLVSKFQESSTLLLHLLREELLDVELVYAASPEEALGKLDGIDAVVTGNFFGTYNMSGVDFLAKVKSIRNIPVCLFSGDLHVNQDIAQRFDHYLCKFSSKPTDLIGLIKKMLPA